VKVVKEENRPPSPLKCTTDNKGEGGRHFSIKKKERSKKKKIQDNTGAYPGKRYIILPSLPSPSP
jgi:hypothetical protein